MILEHVMPKPCPETALKVLACIASHAEQLLGPLGITLPSCLKHVVKHVPQAAGVVPHLAAGVKVELVVLLNECGVRRSRFRPQRFGISGRFCPTGLGRGEQRCFSRSTLGDKKLVVRLA
jgi:hypothetical protein